MSAVKDTKKRRRTKIAVLTTAFVVIASGAAYAYWTTSGSGTGTATTGTNAAVVVTQDAFSSALLYPGATVPLTGKFNNPNPGNAYVTAVTATGYTIDAGHSGCSATGNYTLGGTSNTPGSIPPGNGVGGWSGLTLTMNNLGTNQDACKGAILTITYASS